MTDDTMAANLAVEGQPAEPLNGKSSGPVAELGAGDTFLSLNGFDEIALAKAYGKPVAELRNDPTMFLRAMAFVDQRRQGKRDPEAYQLVMGLPFRDVQAYFPEDVDDEDSPEGEGDGR